MARRAVIVSVKIPFPPERKAVLDWVKTVANRGYSEVGDTLYLTYAEEPHDEDSDKKYWAVVHYFEQHPTAEVIQCVAVS